MYEKVNPQHPDKTADRIAGALVDLAYTKEKNPRVAFEVLLGHGICHIMAETSVHFTNRWCARDGGTETTDGNGKAVVSCLRQRRKVYP